MKRKLALFLSLVMMLSVFAGCGGNAAQPSSAGAPAQSSGGGSAEQQTVTESAGGLKKTYNLSIGTAGTSGTYYPIGLAMAELFHKYNDKLNATAEVTGGSVENIKLVASGDMAIGMAAQTSNFLAVHGLDPFSDEITNLRALVAFYGPNYKPPAALQFIVEEDSDIHSIYDFVGRNVCVGPAGSGGETYAKAVLAAAGITYDMFNVSYMSYDEEAAALDDGIIDVVSVNSGVPTAAVVSMATNHKLRLISIEDDIIEKACAESGLIPRDIEPGTEASYEFMTETCHTVMANYHVVFVNADMEEELAYELTALMLDHIEELYDSNSAVKNVTAEGLTEGLSAIPLHVGAMKYYQEKGIEIPEGVIPPEYAG